MYNCEKICLLCQQPQVFKVNFSKHHGICSDHQASISEFLSCIHCDCFVPIALIDEIKDAKSLLSIKNFKPVNTQPTPVTKPVQGLVHAKLIINSPSSDYSSSTQSELCEYCIANAPLSNLRCHKICQSCFKGHCPLCSTVEPLPLCENCHNSSNTSKLHCGHFICDTCNTAGCDLCNFISRPDSLYITQRLVQCEYCQIKPATNCCVNEHNLCSECYEQECQLCRFSIRPTLCENCKSARIETCCKNGHSLCVDCEKNCALCSNDFFSVLEPEKDEKKIGEENGKVEEGRLESSATGTWIKGVESRKESGNDVEERGSKFACTDTVKSHYKGMIPEGKIVKTGKKSEGSTSCRECDIF